jgi:diacylglycerol kinase
LAFSFDRWLRVTVNSWTGLIAATRDEQYSGTGCARVRGAASLCDHRGICKRRALIAAVLFVVVVELLHTAIEKPPRHLTGSPPQGRIKDIGSARSGLRFASPPRPWLVAIGERLAIL